MEPMWLAYGKRLQAIAATGIHYTRDPFDRERFEEIEAIANEMLAILAEVPIERIRGLISHHARGYPTPKVDVRGALVEDGAVLLVQEKSDGRWTLPGGFADIGLSAARNVEKEVLEEAGVTVCAASLYAVRHKAGAGYPPDVRDFYKMFFLCNRLERTRPQAGAETMDARFFRLGDLPPLSLERTLESDIAAAFAYSADPQRPAWFD